MKQVIQFPEQNYFQKDQLLQRVTKLMATLLLLTLFASAANAQTTIHAVQSGLWNDPDTWDGTAVPTAADDVVIDGGYTVTVNAAGAVCNSLIVGQGDWVGSSALVFSGTSSLTVTNDILLGDPSGATGTITMDNNAVFTCGSVSEGDPGYSGIYETNLGTIIFTGSFTLPYNLFQFTNLVVNGSVSTGGRNLPIEGDLTVNNGAVFDLGVNTANRNTIAGTFTVANGATLRIGGGGTIPANFSTHVIGATSTIEYYGVSQTVATLNSSQNYGNLTISGSGLKEVNGNIGIAGNLTVNSGIFSVNTFTANRTSAGGTLTVANGATLRIAGAGTLPANFNTHAIGATSTIEYSGTSSQNVAALNSGQQYGNLNLYNSVKTLSGSITVRGAVSFGGTPNKLVIGSNTLTMEGSIIGSLSTSRNFTGSSASNIVVYGAANRTLYMDASTPGTTNILNNLTLNHSGYVTTLGNDIVVNGNLTFTAGKLALSTKTLTLKGNFVNTVSGGVRGGTSSKLVIDGTSSPVLSMDQTTAGSTNVLSTLQINSSGQVLTLDGDLVMNSTLTFSAGKLAIGSNTLTLKGLVTNTVSGGLRGGANSNLIINGTVSPSLSFDQTTAGTTNIIKNITINSTGQTVTLLNALRLTGTHTPTSGVFASGGNYTVASSASGTANIAAGSTSGGYITGNVTVERYIPQNTNRAWRLLTAATSGQTIKQAWQENQAATVNGNPGYGTIITSNAASWSDDGFDYQTPGMSIMSYDPSTDEMIPVSNTNQAIDNESGYFIYIRGSRAVTPSSSISAMDATVLRSTGTLFTGNQSAAAVGANQFALIGNPFPSALDIRNITTAGGCTGTSFYVWDPKLEGAYSLGGFQTLTPSGGNYVVVPGGGSYGSSGSVVNTIQSGAAFMVQATGSSGSVTITESCKTSGSNIVFRPADVTNDQTIITNLYAVNNGTKRIADGNMIFFNNSYDNAVDAFDSRKQLNFGENFGLIDQQTSLVVERRNFPVSNDTIQYEMSALKRMQYELEIIPGSLQGENMIAVLQDKYLNAEQVISYTDTTRYLFTVTTAAASAASDRFRIVFKTGSILSVSVTDLTARLQQTNAVVAWKVNNEAGVRSYIIEHSSDARSFSAKGIVAASLTGAVEKCYSFTDPSVVTGTHYYRIKIVYNNGTSQYTNVVKLVAGSGKSTDIVIFPNPVTAGKLNLVFTAKPAGNYTVKLLNENGQLLYSKNVQHGTQDENVQIQLPAGLPAGIYRMQLIGPDKEKQVLPVVLESGK